MRRNLMRWHRKRRRHRKESICNVRGQMTRVFLAIANASASRREALRYKADRCGLMSFRQVVNIKGFDKILTVKGNLLYPIFKCQN